MEQGLGNFRGPIWLHAGVPFPLARVTDKKKRKEHNGHNAGTGVSRMVPLRCPAARSFTDRFASVLAAKAIPSFSHA